MKDRQKASLGTRNLIKYIETFFPQTDFRAIVFKSNYAGICH